MINYQEFKQVELKVAKVLEAERIEGSGKLLKLKIDLGSESRQIIAGIGEKYQPEDLLGRNIIVVTNLEPRTLLSLESQGMLLAASNDNEGPVLLTTMEEIKTGSEVR